MLWALLATAALAGGVAGAAPPDDVFLEEIGPGWHRSTEGACLGQRCFKLDGTSWSLAILEIPVSEGVDVRAAAQMAAAFAAQTAPAGVLREPPVPSPGLDAAWWLHGEGVLGAVRILVIASELRVFQISLHTSGDVALDPDETILDVARRQQLRAGGPPSSAANPAIPPDLAALLVADPPPGFAASEPIVLQEPYDLIYGPFGERRLVDLLEREQRTVTRIFTRPGSSITVWLRSHPYDHLAAVELGVLFDYDIVERVSLEGIASIEDAVAFKTPLGGIGIQFRRGHHGVFIWGLPIDPSTEPRTRQAVVDVASRQEDVLPKGGTGPFFFPSRTAAIVTAIAATTAVCLAMAGVGWLAVLRSRRDRRPPPRSPEVIDVSPAAARLRWMSVLLTVVQILAINTVVVGVLFVLDGLEAWSAALVAAGTAIGVLFTHWRARSELRATGPEGPPPHTMSVSIGVLLAGTAAALCLVAGVAVGATGLQSLIFGPTLTRLEWSVEFGISPLTQSLMLTATGVVLLVLGGVMLRVARRRSWASATRVRAADRRPPVLYLRSFEDDDHLRVAAVATPRRPFLEMFRLGGNDPFEEALAWELAPHGPVVAIGRPGRRLASLGAARDHLPDDEWREGVAGRMNDAGAIVVVIGATDGLAWEVGQIARAGHLDKTIFVFPPTEEVALRHRWGFVEAVLDDLGIKPAPLPVDAASPLTAHLPPSGLWRVTVANYRDEASYCAGVDSAMRAASMSTALINARGAAGG